MSERIRSGASSTYSSVPPYNPDIEIEYPNERTQVNEVNKYHTSNPYSHSLWYDLRGEFVNDAISEIKERTSKRKRDELPLRKEFLEVKKVDSPIKNESFLLDPVKRGVVCESPIYKTIGLKFPDSDYRKSFKEFINTELKYQSDLKLINSVYRDMLHNTQKFKYILSKDQESVIFGNIDAVIDLSDLILKQITKEIRSESNGPLKLDLKEHFDYINIEKVNLGRTLKDQLVRLRIIYTSYYLNFEAQMETLLIAKKHGGPKIIKWLQECAYLAKSRSDCWDFQSLMIKPVQRLTKYVLLINALLETSNDEIQYEYVNDLYDAKTEMEKLLDSIDKSKIANNEGQTEEEKVAQSRSLLKVHTLDRADYIQKVNEFKQHYSFLTSYKKKVEQSLGPLFNFTSNQRKFAQSWENFMGSDNNDGDENYIGSVYAIYLQKMNDHETVTKLIINDIKEKVIKAVELVLEHCSVVKTKINKHNSNRGAYATYLKHIGSFNSANFYSKVSAKDAQEYIVIENEIRDELPSLLDKLSQFCHYIALLYHSLVTNWLKQLSGDSQIEQYQELLKTKNMGDNFDILEMFAYNRMNTKEALQDICYRSNESLSIFSTQQHSQNQTSYKLSASKIVRRLFGI